jgi:hypothetical protein
MKKAMLARLFPSWESVCHGLYKQACDGHFKRPPLFASRMTCIWRRPSADDGSQRPEFCCILEQQSRSRSERGDVFSKFRASSLVKGFGNAAPAREPGAALMNIRVNPCNPWFKKYE